MEILEICVITNATVPVLLLVVIGRQVYVTVEVVLKAGVAMIVNEVLYKMYLFKNISKNNDTIWLMNVHVKGLRAVKSPKGVQPNSGVWPGWVRPGLARRFGTTRRRRIADV